MQNKTKVPEQISAAIDALLSPYGVSLEALNQSNPQTDETRYLPKSRTAITTKAIGLSFNGSKLKYLKSLTNPNNKSA